MQQVDDPAFDECAWAMGAVTRRIGSSAKNSVPSGIACIAGEAQPAS
jgi:hypothetical protein